ncbi:MAG: inverse autotransporter beta domain-containing protein [Tatlockia sp.]|nr:inverse autotransporter beta domain-containing protein [Tatlockia sp.]
MTFNSQTIHLLSYSISSLVLIILGSPLSYASIDKNTSLPPRLFIEGTTVSNTFGKGDLMLPLFGQNNQLIHGDIQAKYGNQNAWVLSGGLGTRTIQNQAILGAYFFTDYNKTPNGNYFTVLNPGLEVMTNHWDWHLNGYAPLGKKYKTIRILNSNQAGKTNTQFFSGHTQYNRLFDLIEDVGPGADLELGFTPSSFKRTRAFVGGYYFTPKYTSNVRGVEAGFEIPLNYSWASLEVRDTYDNVNKNTFVLTLRLKFGGLNKTDGLEIHNRLLDRIPRHLGSYDRGDGIPSKKEIIYKGRTVVEQNNLWFFNPDSYETLAFEPTSFQSCTFEHPCVGLSQSRIDAINGLSPNAKLYLSSGLYTNQNTGASFNIRNGQYIYGRTTDFSQPALNLDRPLINDSLFLEGNNNVYNLRVNGQSVETLSTGGELLPFQVGILIKESSFGNVNLYNSEVTATSSLNNVIALANNANAALLTINNSNLISNSINNPGAITVGVGNLRTGSLTMNNSTINATTIDTINNGNVVFGAVNNESGKFIISNTSIAVNATHGSFASGILNNASLGLGLGTVTVNNSTISTTGFDVNQLAGIVNQANNVGGISSDINVNQSTITINSNNNGGGIAAGVIAQGTGDVSLTNSAINSSGDSGTITGILIADATASVNLLKSTISINTSGTATGTPITSMGNLNDQGGNQCFQNGVPVTC